MKNITALLMTLILATMIAQAKSADVALWAETALTKEDQITLTPYIKTSNAAHLRYVFKVYKQGQSGRSKTQQSGKVSPQPNQPQALSALSLNLKTGDQISIELRIYEENKLVAELEFELPAEKYQKKAPLK